MPHSPSVVVRLLFLFFGRFFSCDGVYYQCICIFFLRFFESVETFVVFGFTLIIIMSFFEKKFKKNY